MSAQDVNILPHRPTNRAATKCVKLGVFDRYVPDVKPVSGQPFSTPQKVKAPKTDEVKEVLFEDFSKFTLGSEAAPDATSLTGDVAGYIPDEYTLQSGWAGDGVFQAGGVAYLGLASDGYSGYVTTPSLNLASDGGNAKLSFRLKLQDGASDYLYVGWGDFNSSDEPNYTFIEVTGDWQDYELDLTGCGTLTNIQVYALTYYCFLDDFRVTQNDVLATPVPNVPTDYDGYSFTASWSAVDGATSYLLSVFTLDASDGVTRDYFIERQEVTSTSYYVEGLDPSQNYYYTVTAKNDSEESSESSPVELVITVEDLDTPQVMPATDVTSDGFTANWLPVNNANYYSFYTYLLHMALTDEQFDFIDTDFSSITGGTVDNPQMEYMYMYLDNYLDRADWYAQIPLFADGMLGVSNLYADFGYYGILMSPILDLSNNGGSVRVDMSVLGVDVSSLTVQLVDASTDTETLIDSETMAVGSDLTQLSCVLEGATSQCYISIYPDTGSGNLFFDDLRISQDLKAGDMTEVPYMYAETTTTSVYVPVTEVNPGDVFGYCVAALYVDDEGSVVASSYFSDIMLVEGLTGLDSKTVDGSNAYVFGGSLYVSNPLNEDVSVYSVDGTCVFSASSTDSTWSMGLQQSGIYIVRIGGKVFKVMK